MFHRPHTDPGNKTGGGQSGFVLLEVLIAAVIATVTLIAVFHAYSTAFSGSARTERVTIAVLAAESKMAALGIAEALEPGVASGRLDGGYGWRTEIRPYDGLPEADLARLPVRAYLVEVTVSWGGGAAQSITLSSLRLAAVEDGRGETR